MGNTTLNLVINCSFKGISAFIKVNIPELVLFIIPEGSRSNNSVMEVVNCFFVTLFFLMTTGVLLLLFVVTFRFLDRFQYEFFPFHIPDILLLIHVHFSTTSTAPSWQIHSVPIVLHSPYDPGMGVV